MEFIVLSNDGRFVTNNCGLSFEYPEARLFDSKREALAVARSMPAGYVKSVEEYANGEWDGLTTADRNGRGV